MGQTFSYRHFSLEEGLPSSQVYDVEQDDDGFIWYGTDRGIVRFDGYEFEVFTTDNGLPDNVIFHLCKDRLGRIWFATFSAEIGYFENGEIKLFEHNDVITEEIGVPLIISFLVDDYMGVHLGFKWSGYIHIDKDGNVERLPKEGTFTLVEVRDKVVFFKGSELLVEHNGEYLVKLNYTRSSNEMHEYIFPGKNKSLAFNIVDAAIKSEETVFFSVNKSLFKFQDERVEWVANAPSRISVLMIVDGEIWIGMFNAGFIIMDLETKAIVSDQNLDNRTICDFFEDDEGAIWITTLNDGVYYLPDFHHYSLTVNNGVQYRNVFSIASSGSHLLISDWEGNLSWLDMANDSSYAVTEYVGKLEGTPYISYFNGDGSFVLTSKGAFVKIKPGWSGVYDYNMGIYYGVRDTLYNIRTYHSPLDTRQKGIEVIESFISSEGIVKKGIKNCFYTKGRRFVTGLSGLYEMVENSNGDYDSIVPWKLKHPIYETRMVGMSEYEGFDFIVATRGEGVLFVKDEVPYPVKKEHGLLSNQVTAVFVDSAQHIWVGTSSGVSIIDRQRGIFNLRVEDGLISNEITAIYANSEKAYIGTKKGITILELSKVFRQKRDIPVVFKSIKTEDKSLLKVNNNALEIDYDEAFLAIEFVGISYKSIGRIQYKYRMNPDENWQYTKINKLLLSNLSPGSYNLEIYASNGENNWSSQPAIMQINVLFPFWQTWWFKTIEFLLLFFLLIMGYRFAVYRIRSREKKERQIQSLRFEALSAQMNPHFIFNSLNSIQNFVIQNDKKASVQYLSKFAKLMRKTLDHSQEKNIILKNELEALFLYLDLEILRFGGNQIHYDVHIDEEIQTDKVILPALLIQPVVENAILHGLRPKGSAGLIRMAFMKQGNQLVIQIEDNGVGRRKKANLQKPGQHQSKGGALTEERISLFSAGVEGDYDYSVVDMKEGGESAGTRVNISIPYVLSDNFGEKE